MLITLLGVLIAATDMTVKIDESDKNSEEQGEGTNTFSERGTHTEYVLSRGIMNGNEDIAPRERMCCVAHEEKIMISRRVCECDYNMDTILFLFFILLTYFTTFAEVKELCER